MHPCCWGPFFQTIAQALPFLAVIFFGGKKLFSMFRHLLPFKQKQKESQENCEPISVEQKSCCSAKNSANSSTISEPVTLIKLD